MNRKSLLISIVALSAVMLAGCNTTTPTATTTTTPGAITVDIKNSAFATSTITVKQGETVSWTNSDGMAHTVTATDGSFDSGTMSNGAVFSHKFDQKGEFNYRCKFHSNMTGKVIVQ